MLQGSPTWGEDYVRTPPVAEPGPWGGDSRTLLQASCSRELPQNPGSPEGWKLGDISWDLDKGAGPKRGLSYMPITAASRQSMGRLGNPGWVNRAASGWSGAGNSAGPRERSTLFFAPSEVDFLSQENK